MSTKRFVVFDLETSGMNARKHDIIQIAAVAVDLGFGEPSRILDTFETKVAFDEAAAVKEALEVNHYNREDWVGAPPIKRVLDDFNRFCSKNGGIEMVSKTKGTKYYIAMLVAYNANFDANFLREKYDSFKDGNGRGMFRAFVGLTRCAMHALIGREVSKDGSEALSYKLENVCARLGIDPGKSHSALSDAIAAAHVYAYATGASPIEQTREPGEDDEIGDDIDDMFGPNDDDAEQLSI